MNELPKFLYVVLGQSSGFVYCFNDTISFTHNNHTKIFDVSDCCALYTTFAASIIGSIVPSLGTVLTLTCAILYICFWIRLRARAGNLTGRSDMHKLRWRLSVIVLLNTLCWVPVTILHWTVIFDSIPNINIEWFNDSTAANVLLISISPAVNPLIYTFTGKNFLHSIRKFCRRIKCDIFVRRSSSNYHDDHTREVERCSCIPCVRCVQHDEENDPDYCNTQGGIVIRADSCCLPMNQVKLTNRFTSTTSCCMDYHSNSFQCVSLHFSHIVWMFAIKIVCMFIIKSRSVVYIR